VRGAAAVHGRRDRPAAGDGGRLAPPDALPPPAARPMHRGRVRGGPVRFPGGARRGRARQRPAQQAHKLVRRGRQAAAWVHADVPSWCGRSGLRKRDDPTQALCAPCRAPVPAAAWPNQKGIVAEASAGTPSCPKLFRCGSGRRRQRWLLRTSPTVWVPPQGQQRRPGHSLDTEQQRGRRVSGAGPRSNNSPIDIFGLYREVIKEGGYLANERYDSYNRWVGSINFGGRIFPSMRNYTPNNRATSIGARPSPPCSSRGASALDVGPCLICIAASARPPLAALPVVRCGRCGCSSLSVLRRRWPPADGQLITLQLVPPC
jgi:hypothetical protein